MRASKKNAARNLGAAVIWFNSIGANPAFAANTKKTDDESSAEKLVNQEENETAPISGWQFGLGFGYSPACLGSKREFGHYRCGGMTEITASPPPDNSLFIKSMFHDLKTTRIIGENPATAQRSYDVERINLSSLVIGKKWGGKRLYLGAGAGIFNGSIKRSTDREDEYYNIKPDEHARYVSTSGYTFTAFGGSTLVQTNAGDLNMELSQTYFATTEASHPRDERRVWGTLPTLAFGWNYRFK